MSRTIWRQRRVGHASKSSSSRSARIRVGKPTKLLVAVLTLAHRAGLDIRRYRPVGARRMALLRQWEITMLVDVGANVGQYASELRDGGYAGQIESFEPIPAVYAELCRRAAGDPGWKCHAVALGDFDGEAQLNVTAQSASSSLRRVTQDYGLQDSAARTVEVLTVPVRRLDGLALELPDDATLLKLDAQGYEDTILRGAAATLGRITLIECELSVRALYEDQPLVADMLDLLRQAGFELIALNPGYYDVTTGEILQFDGTFARAASR